MKQYQKTVLYVSLLIFFVVGSTITVPAGNDGSAGVGVVNVPPNYADIKILQRDNTLRVYLTLSDYNSWMDIQNVRLNLEENGVVLHTFLFQQYSNPETFEKINSFTELSNDSLLVKDACYVSHSLNSKTIADRCQLELRFVFKTTYFSQLHVISSDRAGDSTETFIEYKGSDMNRDANILLIPWIDGTIKVELPAYVLEISLLFMAIIATVLIGKKTPFVSQFQQVFYETK